MRQPSARGPRAARRGSATRCASAAIFGFFEAITPAIGWAVGLALSTWIATVDHWVAFILLGAVGGHMLLQAYRSAPIEEDAALAKRQGIGRLVVTALATSIDTMAVGVTLAFLHVNILIACLVIGGITTIVATAGVTVGRHAGVYLGRYAEALGGLTLITTGSVILFEHLTACHRNRPVASGLWRGMAAQCRSAFDTLPT